MSEPERPEDFSPERRRDLAKAIAAYQHLMNEAVTESQHFQGRRENVDRTAALGNIIERADARQRERDREQAAAS